MGVGILKTSLFSSLTDTLPAKYTEKLYYINILYAPNHRQAHLTSLYFPPEEGRNKCRTLDCRLLTLWCSSTSWDLINRWVTTHSNPSRTDSCAHARACLDSIINRSHIQLSQAGSEKCKEREHNYFKLILLLFVLQLLRPVSQVGSINIEMPKQLFIFIFFNF